MNQIRWKNFDVFGFDLDHTFATYKFPEQLRLCYNSLAQCAIEDFNYTEDLLYQDGITERYMRRGLVGDREKGLILKLSNEGKVLRASEGTALMSQEHLMKEFGPEQKYASEKFEQLCNSGSGGPGLSFVSCNFYVPSLALFGKMHDMKGKAHKVTYEMFKCAARVYAKENFKKSSNYYFPAVQKNPCEYIKQNSNEFKMFLRKIRAAGKVVFICTNSHADYAIHVLNTCLQDANWHNYVDFLLCDAEKPKFFISQANQSPFYEWNVEFEKMGVSSVSLLERGRVYVKGNVHTLNESLQKITQKSYECAYFGDSLSSDVVPCKAAGIFHPIAVVEEMESETDDISVKEQLPFATSPTADPWGSIFVDYVKNEDKNIAVKTVFTHLIEKNSLVCIPSVEVLPQAYENDIAIGTFNNDGILKGWFPKPPESLLL